MTGRKSDNSGSHIDARWAKDEEDAAFEIKHQRRSLSRQRVATARHNREQTVNDRLALKSYKQEDE